MCAPAFLLALGLFLALDFPLFRQQLFAHGLDDRGGLGLHIPIQRPQGVQNGLQALPKVSGRLLGLIGLLAHLTRSCGGL